MKKYTIFLMLVLQAFFCQGALSLSRLSNRFKSSVCFSGSLRSAAIKLRCHTAKVYSFASKKIVTPFKSSVFKVQKRNFQTHQSIKAIKNVLDTEGQPPYVGQICAKDIELWKYAISVSENGFLERLIALNPLMLQEKGDELLARAFKITSEKGLEVIKLLVTEGKIDLNKPSVVGDLLLFQAIKMGKQEIVELLIAHGADVNKLQPDGETALRAAVTIRSIELVDLLLKHKANVDEKNGNQRTALFKAVQLGELEIAKLLINHFASVTIVDAHEQTILHVAASSGNTEMVKFLLNIQQIKNVINAQDDVDKTALSIAAAKGYYEIVEMLVHAGADINVESVWRQTPLSLAKAGEHTKVVIFLMQNGAIEKINLTKIGVGPETFGNIVKISPLFLIVLYYVNNYFGS